jgi:hypothetical protein
MWAPAFTFAFLWTDETGAREFAGGLDEFHGYMNQRDAAGQRHHLDLGVRDESREVALGYTTRHATVENAYVAFGVKKRTKLSLPACPVEGCSGLIPGRRHAFLILDTDFAAGVGDVNGDRTAGHRRLSRWNRVRGVAAAAGRHAHPSRRDAGRIPGRGGRAALRAWPGW